MFKQLLEEFLFKINKNIFLEFNFTFKWVDDGAYGFRNKETGEWNGLMGELLAQVEQGYSLGYSGPLEELL